MTREDSAGPASAPPTAGSVRAWLDVPYRDKDTAKAAARRWYVFRDPTPEGSPGPRSPAAPRTRHGRTGDCCCAPTSASHRPRWQGCGTGVSSTTQPGRS